MLSVYTRHSAHCSRRHDPNWKRCRCPKWINGALAGQFICKTAKTRSWEKAEELSLQWEIAANPQKIGPVTLEAAVEAYPPSVRPQPTHRTWCCWIGVCPSRTA